MNGTILTSDIGSKTKLYRTVSLQRLLEMFAHRENVLVRPKLWDDPFENLALQSKAIIGGQVGMFGFKDDYFCQCWTKASVSDAIWRIYSSGTDGVRIRTTVGALLSSLASQQPKQWASLASFVGSVRYLRKKDLVSFSKTHFSAGLTSNGTKEAETLLIKRIAFSHEREVRLIFSNVHGAQTDGDLYRYPLDPHNLVDQILLHPRLSTAAAATLKATIQKLTGFKGRIQHSQLYQLPKGFQFVVGP